MVNALGQLMYGPTRSPMERRGGRASGDSPSLACRPIRSGRRAARLGGTVRYDGRGGLLAVGRRTAFAYAADKSVVLAPPGRTNASPSWLQTSVGALPAAGFRQSVPVDLNDLAFLLTLFADGPAGFLSTFFGSLHARLRGSPTALATRRSHSCLLSLSILAGLVPLAWLLMVIGLSSPSPWSLAASQLSVRRVLNRLNEIVLDARLASLAPRRKRRLRSDSAVGSPAAQLLHDIDDETEHAELSLGDGSWIRLLGLI